MHEPELINDTHLCPHAVEFLELDCVRMSINSTYSIDSADIYVGAIYFFPKSICLICLKQCRLNPAELPLRF